MKPHMQTWEYPYPPTPTAHSSAWLIHYLYYLVVVGGVDCKGKNTTNVEILDTSNSQWYNAEPLPEPCHLQQSTRILDTLHFLGSSPSMPVYSTFITFSFLLSFYFNPRLRSYI